LFRLFEEFSFRDTDIVGRWFSGDEIVIATYDNPNGIVDRLTRRANRLNLSFKHKIFEDVRDIGDLKTKIALLPNMWFPLSKGV
jgi:hypothetical protein